jgi:cytochrome P450
MGDKYPPGPYGGLSGVELYRRFAASPLAFVTDVARTCDGFASLRFGWIDVYFVTRPDLIREVLSTRMKSFPKLRRQMNALARVEGDSIGTSDGEVWRRHRPVVQTAFHARTFPRFAAAFVGHTRRRIERWVPGATFDMAEEMNQLALELIGKVLFNADWGDRVPHLRDAVHVFRECMQKEISSSGLSPDALSPADKLRQQQAVREIDTLIWDLVRERRASAGGGDDILSLMLTAAGSTTDKPVLTDQEIRDEAATLFISGHDTTSAALAWFWYLLARHPEAERGIQREVDDILGDRPAGFADVRRLRYTEAVVKESLRLYPPSGFLYGREAAADVDLGGYPVRRGSWILISPYAAHRDPRVFPDPEVFDPDRFAPGRAETIPPYAYLPFGGGPHTCIGNNFAMVEMVLVVATILQRFSVQLDPRQGEVEPTIEVMLRPKGQVLMRALPRPAPAAGHSA